MELEETYSVKGLLFRPHVIANFQELLGITFPLFFPDFSGETSNLKHFYFLEASEYKKLYFEASNKW